MAVPQEEDGERAETNGLGVDGGERREVRLSMMGVGGVGAWRGRRLR